VLYANLRARHFSLLGKDRVIFRIVRIVARSSFIFLHFFIMATRPPRCVLRAALPCGGGFGMVFLVLSLLLTTSSNSSSTSCCSTTAFVVVARTTKARMLHPPHPQSQQQYDSKRDSSRPSLADGKNNNIRICSSSSSSSLDDEDVPSSSLRSSSSSSVSSSSSSSWRRSIRTASYTLSRESTSLSIHKSRFRQWLVMGHRFLSTRPCTTRNNNATTTTQKERTLLLSLDFDYEYEQLWLGDWNRTTATATGTATATTDAAAAATGILLIHPIGVGIGKWYYHRLLQALLQQQEQTDSDHHGRPVLVVAPDLVGSSSACPPTTTRVVSASDNNTNNTNNTVQNKEVWTRPLPLLNISDWTNQTVQLLHHIQNDIRQQQQQQPTNTLTTTIQNWCIVANGGCAPIALQVAAATSQAQLRRQTAFLSSSLSIPAPPNVTNIILSSVPRLGFFLTSSDPNKVQRSYKTLCGIIGRLFWWYATRFNDGQFIQSFSERNLVANASNLGPDWRRNCVRDATRNHGASRYSTLAFLAGALQDGCRASLGTILGKHVNYNYNTGAIQIDFIRGRDVRRNAAKSWFWQKKRRDNKSVATTNTTTTSKNNETTLYDYVLQENNNIEKPPPRLALIDGRISLAHEDAAGYAAALRQFLDF
jgi:hypothetical protein